MSLTSLLIYRPEQQIIQHDAERFPSNEKQHKWDDKATLCPLKTAKSIKAEERSGLLSNKILPADKLALSEGPKFEWTA